MSVSVAEATERAEHARYMRSIGYTLRDPEYGDMRHLVTLLEEIERLEGVLRKIGEHSASFKPICDRALAGLPIEGKPSA